tara:strand:+ start:18125 stop:18844 length:720 start_codon:yes stop_codon:yes gene_type:complete
LNSNINKKVNHINLGHIDFKKAWDNQESIFKKIIELKIENRKKKENKATENYILVCSHPHVYTLGKSGNEKNLLINDENIKSQKLKYYKINRGGDITYHGPGQLVIYPIIDLENFFTDIHKYLRLLEEAVIMTLHEFGISSGRVKGLTGVWVNIDTNKPKKICAMGVKSSRWVTMHGLALNVSTDLNYFNNIIPCGINDKEVTSIENELNKKIKLEEVENKMLKNLEDVFKFKLKKDKV